MDNIAGTIIAFLPTGEPYFLVQNKETYQQLVTAKALDNMTNMGAILNVFKQLEINIVELELLDLVDVSYQKQHHTPLFVFKLQVEELPNVNHPYSWIKTTSFRKILGNLTLDDIAGLTF